MVCRCDASGRHHGSERHAPRHVEQLDGEATQAFQPVLLLPGLSCSESAEDRGETSSRGVLQEDRHLHDEDPSEGAVQSVLMQVFMRGGRGNDHMP